MKEINQQDQQAKRKKRLKKRSSNAKLLDSTLPLKTHTDITDDAKTNEEAEALKPSELYNQGIPKVHDFTIEKLKLSSRQMHATK